MVHHGEGLAFGVEACEDGAGIHAGFDEFDCDEASDGGALFGHPDDAHAALADGFEEFVAPGDHGARGGFGDEGAGFDGGGVGRCIEEGIGGGVGLEEGFDAGAEVGVGGGDFFKFRVAGGGVGKIDELEERGLELVDVDGHGETPCAVYLVMRHLWAPLSKEFVIMSWRRAARRGRRSNGSGLRRG